MSEKYWAIVPAAGVGRRMGGNTPKQYLEVLGKPVLQHTLERLLSIECLTAIVVALGADDEYWPDIPCSADPRIVTVPGGKERADSVYSGLEFLQNRAADNDWILVHDAARMCLAVEDVHKLIDHLKGDTIGGILALPVSDTLKTVTDGQITGSPDRRHVWRALTPQIFRYGMLRQALSDAASRGLTVTDESSALELAGYRPKIVEGRPDNIKITRPEDLSLAAFYLERQ